MPCAIELHDPRIFVLDRQAARSIDTGSRTGSRFDGRARKKVCPGKTPVDQKAHAQTNLR
jgi:hypothetical protein